MEVSIQDAHKQLLDEVIKQAQQSLLFSTEHFLHWALKDRIASGNADDFLIQLNQYALEHKSPTYALTQNSDYQFITFRNSNKTDFDGHFCILISSLPPVTLVYIQGKLIEVMSPTFETIDK